jgi:HSP20 family protein
MRYIQFTQPSYRGTPGFGFGARAAGYDNQLDWLFGTALTGFANASQGVQFPVDLYEDKQNTYVRAELPGVNRDAVNVEYADGSLSIKASRKAKAGEGETDVELSRVVSILDEVHADKVSAAYENGVLTVTLPRQEETKAKKINVSVN